ncbi:hypothetical protein NL676_022557 [Syzygium grande]|nr:hypothetical protein NL676_022557 [Syzygium grande]
MHSHLFLDPFGNQTTHLGPQIRHAARNGRREWEKRVEKRKVGKLLAGAETTSVKHREEQRSSPERKKPCGVRARCELAIASDRVARVLIGCSRSSW